MATNFCQKCKREHPGRECDYDDAGECAETEEAPQEADFDDDKKIRKQ
jgi:hypothetical protein